MEEFKKALSEKKYVDAANQLEKVRAADVLSTQPNLYSELRQRQGTLMMDILTCMALYSHSVSCAHQPTD